ncbi:unnamed protein product [Dimorphilus gyrociliatus]|uniref:Uncharacterized protein n=1 Tax=Dimorphilus gyrociliatus TaxID=2664684 RepID=A0A7I8W2I8_9ANNE|nr:unnamed protein product [Dimorphilus gyrociliatus]
MPARKCNQKNCQSCNVFVEAEYWSSSDLRITVPINNELTCKSCGLLLLAICKKCSFRIVSRCKVTFENRISNILKRTEENACGPISKHMFACEAECMTFTPIAKEPTADMCIIQKTVKILNMVASSEWKKLAKSLKRDSLLSIKAPIKFTCKQIPFTFEIEGLCVDLIENLWRLNTTGNDPFMSVLSGEKLLFTSIDMNVFLKMETAEEELRKNNEQLREQISSLNQQLEEKNNELEILLKDNLRDKNENKLQVTMKFFENNDSNCSKKRKFNDENSLNNN